MKKNASSAKLAELTETNLRLGEENAMLEAIGRMAFESAHRQSANMKKVSAMARAIARGDVPEGDRAALAATLRQLAEHCECEVREHIQALRCVNRLRRGFSDPELDDEDEGGDWHCATVPPPTTH